GAVIAASLGEVQTVVAARRLREASSVFIGVGRPSTAAILARRVHNPGLVLVYESGTVGAKPTRVPLSIGDGELAETADFIVSVGHGTGPGSRRQLGFRGAGPSAVITDLGVLEPDPATCELTLTAMHPGVELEAIRAATGWDLHVSDDLKPTEPPTVQELTVLRGLTSRLVTTPRSATSASPRTPIRRSTTRPTGRRCC